MKILVTGGTGVIGDSSITELLKRGHEVRLLSRHADRDAQVWPERVEAFPANIGDPDSLTNACSGCDAVLHIAGIAAEKPPELTFERINIEGTLNIVEEANRAKVGRFVFISSLGADRGESPYHQSKFAAEQAVRQFSGSWVILRPGNVYGPGDEVISLILKSIRALPAIPVIDRGDQRFQPVWHEDLAQAVAMAIESDGLASQILELAGSEVTTVDEIVSKLSAITNRSPLRIPVPQFLAEIAANAADAIGVSLPVDTNKLTMLHEENTIRGTNALTDVFNLTPTSLDDGLRKLSEVQPEQLPREGWGPLRLKRFYADIANSTLSREALFERFRNEFSEVMPIDVGVETTTTPQKLEEGVSLSMKLPLRGNLQVRVEKVTSSSVTVATLEGHPIAGAVRFSVTNHEGKIRFEIRVIDRSGTFFDLFAMETVGNAMQNANWVAVVKRVVEMSGGNAAAGVQHESAHLEGEDAAHAEEWVEAIVAERKLKDRTAAIEEQPRADR